MPTVSLENVSFSYADVSVLKNVNLSINAGEFVGVIGPNGGGKTTLLKLLMGFLKPSSGKVEIFGKAPEAVRPRIGYVPQVLRFDKQFPISVFELVLEGRLTHLPWYGIFSQKDKSAALNALKLVGMDNFKNAPFGTLSGGQTQRALIARALASDPDLLLLDEPTASVDSQAETAIYTILKELQRKITIIMVTHDLKAAIEQVERVICVQNTAKSLNPKEVCEHFAFGLYHSPLIERERKT